jgi:AcrR family transcriptional regulator
VPDPRVVRSRQRLFDALVALILERGWDRVQVRDVCARSGVGRSTFYAHFADKEDLLIGGLDLVRDAMHGRRSGRPFGFLRELIDHAGASRRMFRAVIGKKSGLAVQRKFREVIRELVVEDLAAQGVAKAELDVTSRFVAGAFVELLIAWVDGATRQSARELEAAAVRLATPVVAAVQRRR